MIDYVDETEDTLNKIISIREQLYENFAQTYAVNTNKYRNIYLIGSGTSFNSCITAQPFMEKILKKHTIPVNSYNFAHYEQLATNDDLIIAITQEGESTNTIAALKRANGLNCDNFVITEDRVNSCSQIAQNKIILACGFEHIGPKTKGYSASILTFYLIALEAAKKAGQLTVKEYDEYISRLEKTVNNLSKIIKESKNWFEENSVDLKNCHHAYLLGYGNNKGTIMEGALKSLETVRDYFQPFEVEEFLHGPIASMHKETYTITIAPVNYGYERANKLFKALNEQTDHAYSIGRQEGVFSKHVLKGSFINDKDFCPLEYCIPVQLFAFLLYTSQDKDLNIRNYPNTKDILATKANNVK